MKYNKFNHLSITICCLVAALWSEAQCMDPLIKEDGSIKNHLAEIAPTGSIVAFAGAVAPHRWLICDGKEYNSIEYPDLYNVIRLKYVPANEELRVLRFNNDSDKKLFYVPDLRGRVVVGVDGGAGRVTANNTIGASAGEERHKLTVEELASHHHIIGRHPNSGTAGGSNTCGGAITSDCYKTENAGSDQPHNNMQPYTCLNYIINTGNQKNLKIDEQYIEKINKLEKQIYDLMISKQKIRPKWVIFNGNGTTPTILESEGILSVTRNKTSDYTINFSEPFYSENYCSLFSSGRSNSTQLASCPTDQEGYIQTKNSFRFEVFGYTCKEREDPSRISAFFYGK
jgi:microcystin-dependent protein